jgi:hypothetical protein
MPTASRASKVSKAPPAAAIRSPVSAASKADRAAPISNSAAAARVAAIPSAAMGATIFSARFSETPSSSSIPGQADAGSRQHRAAPTST